MLRLKRGNIFAAEKPLTYFKYMSRWRDIKKYIFYVKRKKNPFKWTANVGEPIN